MSHLISQLSYPGCDVRVTSANDEQIRLLGSVQMWPHNMAAFCVKINTQSLSVKTQQLVIFSGIIS